MKEKKADQIGIWNLKSEEKKTVSTANDASTNGSNVSIESN